MMDLSLVVKGFHCGGFLYIFRLRYHLLCPLYSHMLHSCGSTGHIEEM